jgi:hypothetical protein
VPRSLAHYVHRLVDMNRRALVTPLAVVFLSAVALMAQVNGQAQPPSNAKTEQAEMLLTGCLRSGGADTSVAGPSGRIYTLEVTEGAPALPPGSPTPAGTGVASTVTYSLSANASIGLAEIRESGRRAHRPPASPRARG